MNLVDPEEDVHFSNSELITDHIFAVSEWIHPPPGWVKINLDASYIISSNFC